MKRRRRRLMPWLRQRTRWLKGYVQTWLVHMRSPRKLWRELGPLGFLGFQTVVGGTMLSALVHPWFYVLAGFDLAQGSLLARPEALLGWPFWLLAWFDLVTGYLASMALGFLSARRPRLSSSPQGGSADAALLAVDLGGRLPRRSGSS